MLSSSKSNGVVKRTPTLDV